MSGDKDEDDAPDCLQTSHHVDRLSERSPHLESLHGIWTLQRNLIISNLLHIASFHPLKRWTKMMWTMHFSALWSTHWILLWTQNINY